ncbi:cholinesterase 1-like, partial [Oppia nitens]|uniref:cholinesterase 1-like n=1 Tax=Oppia nitens TaxID=1686743 RepID=UPI0023DA20D8
LYVVFIANSVSCIDDNNFVTVKTLSGTTVRGQTLHVLNRDVHQFLNIPFAEPPVGDLRFAKPVPIKEPTKDVIDGTKPGNSCIQNLSPEMKQFIGDLQQSEDCLVLNVWTPSLETTGLKPVMFWIYGGAFSLGSIFQTDYNGSVLATNDVVFVAANYRVGELGFLYGAHESAPGNAGLYDQLLALKWIKDNIESFGGDPNQVTIFGESAGSMSVSAHLLSPLSKGLFKRAIMQSGSLMFNKDIPASDTVRALGKAKQWAQKLGCDPYDYEWLACLRSIADPNLFNQLPENGGLFQVNFPVFGTEFLPHIPQKAFNKKLYNYDVELIAGATKDEGPMLAILLYPILMNPEFNVTGLTNLVAEINDQLFRNVDVRKAVDYYLQGVDDRTDPVQLRLAFSQLYGDLLITCPAYRFARLFAANNSPSDNNNNNVWYYRWNYAPTGGPQFMDPKSLGFPDNTIVHGIDMGFTFGQPLLEPTLFTEKDYDFTIDIIKMWTDFAKFGNPSKDWPKLLDKTTGAIKVKDLTPDDTKTTRVLDNPFESTCDGVWDYYY